MRISDWSSDVCSSDLSYPTTGGSPQTATEDADEQVADQPDATPDPLRWTDKRVRPWMLAGFLGGQAQAMMLGVIGFLILDRLNLRLRPDEGAAMTGLVLMAGTFAILLSQWGLFPLLTLSSRPDQTSGV